MIQNLSFKYVVNRLLHTFDIGQGMHRLPCNYSKIDVVKEPKNTLNRAETDFIMAQIPCLLPAREGPRFWVEPYFPERFARKFGFDQGCPPSPPEIPRSCREAGVGTAYWLTLCSRFQELKRKCDVFFPGSERPVQISYNYAWWYGTQAWRLHERLMPNVVFYGDPPLDPDEDYPGEVVAYRRLLREKNDNVQPRAPEKTFWIDTRRDTVLNRCEFSLPEWTSYNDTMRGEVQPVRDQVPEAKSPPREPADPRK